MKKILIAVLISLFIPILSWGACTSGGTNIWNCSIDQASITACLGGSGGCSGFAPEDTINVASGSTTWSTTIAITEGVSLIGAGVGNTNITSGTTSYLITYTPSGVTLAQDYNFRVSGFTFVMGNASGRNHAIQLNGSESLPVQSNIRIDNNRFTGYSSSGDHNGCILNKGMWGVVDNNIFHDITYPARVGWGAGNGQWEWDTFTQIAQGTADFLYIEDNTFTDLGGTLSDGDQGGRYVFRYNDITWASGLSDQYNPFDLHSFRGSLHAAMGGEIYGNKIDGNDTDKILAKHRGGRLFAFFNTSTNASHNFTISVYNNESSCDADEYITYSYYFNNRANYTGTLTDAGNYGSNNCGDCDEDEEWFQYKTGFNGTTGMGCGTLAEMNAITPTLTGAGFWVTTQGNCDDITGYVGKDAANEIEGTLYKWSGSAWESFYIPYSEYPHPLRGETDYYVDTDGSGSTCSADTPCALSYANSNADEGDTVYLLTGTYGNDGYINPTNSGTNGNRITYVNSGGAVTISGQTYAVYLDSDDYVTVDGIDGANCTQMVIITNGSDYNIIKNGSYDDSSDSQWTASAIYHDSSNNLIQNCQFSKGGACTGGGSDDGLVFELGREADASDDLTNYNLIEDSIFFHGGHHVFAIHSRYNTIRNNYMHNEAWSNGKGNRVLYTTGYAAKTGYILIENNQIGYAAPPCDDVLVSQVNLSTGNNLIRYNSFYHGNASAIAFYGYAGFEYAHDNYVYNNTFFNNGDELYGGSDADQDAAVVFWYSGSVIDNVLKNNLYYSHNQIYGSEGGNLGAQTFANEWGNDTDSVDPLFTNASTTLPGDKTDSTVPDLTLSSASSAINAGGALTTVTSGCNSSTLVLDDAKYFQDGTWGPSGTVDADWIAVGTVGNTAQISSISGNTVTMTGTVSCTNTDDVWLYKDSDGTVVLYGLQPDAGANESGGVSQSISGVTISELRINP